MKTSLLLTILPSSSPSTMEFPLEGFTLHYGTVVELLAVSELSVFTNTFYGVTCHWHVIIWWCVKKFLNISSWMLPFERQESFQYYMLSMLFFSAFQKSTIIEVKWFTSHTTMQIWSDKIHAQTQLGCTHHICQNGLFIQFLLFFFSWWLIFF